LKPFAKLDQISPDKFIKEADEDTLVAQMVALTQFLEEIITRYRKRS
jgi:hypothetical protein